jgi:rubrerythrin
MRPASSCTGQASTQNVDGGSSRLALLGAASTIAVVAAIPGVRRLLQLGDANASRSKAQDAAILQLVLQLEYTQVAFYEEALQRAGLKGDLRDFARIALGHERQHLAAIQKALGAKARAKPTFDFGDRTKDRAAFTRAAIDLEDAAVAGYNGQATNLTKRTLAAAAEIVSVEARHAAWIRAIDDRVAAPDPVDKPLTAKQTARRLQTIGLRAER